MERPTLGNPATHKALADDLKKYIADNKLFQNIQGKEYVNVEAWQYAGACLGLTPVLRKVKDLSDTTEIKYRSKVEIVEIGTGAILGAGLAICSNKEQGRKYYQEYAIASMSQTRAVGKAYRNILGFLVRLAGYEATPAEEMTTDTPKEENAAEVPKKAGKAPVPKGIKPPAPDTPEITGPTEATAKTGEQIKWATSKQKEEIIRLLNTPVITRQEKTKMLLNINKLDEERAKQSIAKLKKAIDDREKEQATSQF